MNISPLESIQKMSIKHLAKIPKWKVKFLIFIDEHISGICNVWFICLFVWPNKVLMENAIETCIFFLNKLNTFKWAVFG